MSTPNSVNLNNLDGRYIKAADVDTKIAAQAATDAGQYLTSDGTRILKNGVVLPVNTSSTSPGAGQDIVELADVQSYGHSYGFLQTGQRATWFGRVQARIRASSYTNNNVSGAQAADQAGAAAVNAAPAFRGLVLWDCTINDANRNSVSGTLSGFQKALLTWLYIRRASAKFEAETYATETGTWTSVNDVYASGGTVRQTTVQNSQQSYAVSGSTGWFLLLGGGVTGTTMGTPSIAVDGTTVSTPTLSNIYAVTQNNSSRTWFPYAVLVTVPNTSSHTITITKSDSGSGPIIVDALYAQAVAPPLIVLNKAIYPVSGATSNTVDTYNAAIDAIAGQVATDGSIITVDAQASGFTASTMTNDGLHPNNYGAAMIATTVVNAISAISKSAATTIRTGVDFNGTVTISASVTAPAAGGGSTSTLVSDSFNRADSATTLGSPDTGSAWVSVGGTYGISSNQAYVISSTSDTTAVINSSKSDVTVTVTFATIGNFQRLIWRSDGTNSAYWMIQATTGNVYQIYMRSGTNFTQVGGNYGSAASGDVVSVTTSGNTHTVKINGNQITSFTNSAYATNTYHGIGGIAGSVRWDNFSVTG